MKLLSHVNTEIDITDDTTEIYFKKVITDRNTERLSALMK